MTTDAVATSPVSAPNGALATLIAMFSEPGKAFDTVRENSRTWLPLLLIIVSSMALIVWYYQIVDFRWLQDLFMAQVKDAAQREQGRAFIKKSMLMWSAVGGIAIGLPLIFALHALYFLVVAKIRKLDIGFGKWFAFVIWASVPALLGLPLGAIQILLASNGQIDPGQLNPVSLNTMLFHIEQGQRYGALLSSLSLITFWNWLLMVVGFERWAKTSRATSVFIVLLPNVVFYGVWFLIALLGK